MEDVSRHVSVHWTSEISIVIEISPSATVCRRHLVSLDKGKEEDREREREKEREIEREQKDGLSLSSDSDSSNDSRWTRWPLCRLSALPRGR